tara:strand:- start:22 stop:609 length:588 start_codon:yes stop_codon:yes gene_type:complete
MGILVYGVGYNSGGIHLPTENRKHTKVYAVWKDMIRRGYSQEYKDKHNTYQDVTVAKEWLDFQVFGDWFYSNYVVGFCLDKDILIKDNKIYCPEYCRFIPHNINLLFTNRLGKCRNTSLPLGVSERKGKIVKYTAWCNNGKGKTLNLGTYDTPDEASKIYCTFKKGLAYKVAIVHLREGNIDELTYNAIVSWEIN